MSQASALYHLQSLDLEIAAQQARLAEVNATLGDDLPIRRVKAFSERAKAQLAPWQTRVTDLELEMQSLVAKSRQTEQRLYSGTVSNPKELQDMQQEMASLKRRHADLEESLLEAMVKVEEHQALYNKALKKLGRMKMKWSENQASLAEEKTTLEAQRATLDAERAAAWAALDAEAQALYDALRTKKKGQVVALLEGTNCGLCGVAQTSRVVQQVRRGNGLVRCSGCDRVLFGG